MSRLLIYGFGAYANYPGNISEQVLSQFPALKSVRKVVFDVRFDRRMFETVVLEETPEIVLGLGQHPRARKLRLERRARNLKTSTNGVSGPVTPRGPSDRYANLPLPETALTTTSYDAGTYVCNYSMYLMGEYCARSGGRFGFIHIPMNHATDPVNRYLLKVMDFLGI